MDVVKLLPDSVANQIAAGEVVQRPSSVVKELMENAVDAGAKMVKVIVKGSGKQSITVIDDGCGMSESDARLAFERHATSKIRQAEDLFSIKTMGFRGEALPSIASVAQVEIRTRREDSQLGTLIVIEGSKVMKQEPAECAKGTQFTVKNLFFNVPARRKFLKSDETEMKNILQEFQRVAMAHKEVGFKLFSGEDLMIELVGGSMKQRVTQLFGRHKKSFEKDLIPISADTTLVKIEGFVGRPETAGKCVPQHFMVNDRYIVHPYFRRAVIQAYDRMLQGDAVPMFFIELRVEPQTLDVNIHPTKTEVKFENEREIYSILVVAIKEALGKFNITPSLDFDNVNNVDIPVYNPGGCGCGMKMPEVKFDNSYNPFSSQRREEKPMTRNWETMFEGMKHEKREAEDQNLGIDNSAGCNRGESTTSVAAADGDAEVGESIYYRGRWLCVALKSGLALIDVPMAMQRIKYDDIMMMEGEMPSQKLLFDEILQFRCCDDECIFHEIEVDLSEIGFRFEQFGPMMYRMDAVPAVMPEGVDSLSFVQNVIDGMKEGELDVRHEFRAQLAMKIAILGAKNVKQQMGKEERDRLVSRLFASSNPNNVPSGGQIIRMIEL